MAKRSLKSWEDCLEAFIQCDHEHCADIDDIRAKGVLLLSRELYPQEFKSFLRCSEQFANNEDALDQKCGPMIDTLLDNATPNFDKAAEQYRLYQNNNLQNFDPEKYRDQFWYTPLGALWKRQRHNKDITPIACLSIEQAGEQCVDDNVLNNSDCMKFRYMSYLCRAGISCIDTQDSLAQCYSKFVNLGDRKAALPQGFIDCVNQVPQFKKHSQAK